MTSLLYHFVDTELWLHWGLVDRAMNLALWIGGALLALPIYQNQISLIPGRYKS
jgi:hypothetical protein